MTLLSAHDTSPCFSLPTRSFVTRRNRPSERASERTSHTSPGEIVREMWLSTRGLGDVVRSSGPRRRCWFPRAFPQSRARPLIIVNSFLRVCTNGNKLPNSISLSSDDFCRLAYDTCDFRARKKDRNRYARLKQSREMYLFQRASRQMRQRALVYVRARDFFFFLIMFQTNFDYSFVIWCIVSK